MLPAIVLPELAKKALPYLIFTGVIVGLGLAVYQHGYSRGTTEVQLKWEQDKLEASFEREALLVMISKQEEAHRIEQEKVANELAHVRRESEVAVADARASFEQRLLQSARRAEVYQRQAQAGAAAQRDLASHATRLDRALEEGIGLVGELQATLGLREQQLILLGHQISNDRKLCEGSAP